MPLKVYECEAGHRFTALVREPDWPAPTCCEKDGCSQPIAHDLPQGFSRRYPPGEKPCTDPAEQEARNRSQDWFDTTGRELLKSEEYELDTSDKYSDNADGDAASSSITSLLETGNLRSLATKEELSGEDPINHLSPTERRVVTDERNQRELDKQAAHAHVVAAMEGTQSVEIEKVFSADPNAIPL